MSHPAEKLARAILAAFIGAGVKDVVYLSLIHI